MSEPSKRSTFYIEPTLHRALRVKSAETEYSMSHLVNKALREMLSEDAEDLAAFDERAGEPLVSFEDMLKKLKKNGTI
jgi:hypothetical protein